LHAPKIFTQVPQGVKESLDSKYHVLGRGVGRVRMILALSKHVTRGCGGARRPNQWKPAPSLRLKSGNQKEQKSREHDRIGKVGQFKCLSC